MTRVAKAKSVGVRAYADHEIAPRPLTAQALGAGEERYRILADNIAQLAWTADQAGSSSGHQRWTTPGPRSQTRRDGDGGTSFIQIT